MPSTDPAGDGGTGSFQRAWKDALCLSSPIPFLPLDAQTLSVLKIGGSDALINTDLKIGDSDAMINTDFNNR